MNFNMLDYFLRHLKFPETNILKYNLLLLPDFLLFPNCIYLSIYINKLRGCLVVAFREYITSSLCFHCVQCSMCHGIYSYI